MTRRGCNRCVGFATPRADLSGPPGRGRRGCDPLPESMSGLLWTAWRPRVGRRSPLSGGVSAAPCACPLAHSSWKRSVYCTVPCLRAFPNWQNQGNHPSIRHNTCIWRRATRAMVVLKGLLSPLERHHTLGTGAMLCRTGPFSWRKWWLRNALVEEWLRGGVRARVRTQDGREERDGHAACAPARRRRAVAVPVRLSYPTRGARCAIDAVRPTRPMARGSGRQCAHAGAWRPPIDDDARACAGLCSCRATAASGATSPR